VSVNSAKNPHPTVVGLGESLWDLLPEGKHIGGAPLNFSYISSLLGARSIIASRLGCDRLGDEILGTLSSRGLETSHLQRDPRLPTGTVHVAFIEGQPRYQITQPVAWDALEFTDPWRQLANQADIVCFGSLAQRSPPSRATIQAFLAATRSDCIRLFDVNLRSPFYSPDVLRESARLATILKCNDEELPEVSAVLGHAASPTRPGAQALAAHLKVDLVAITLGAHGSVLATPKESAEHAGFAVKVADTVGAGDAFAAALASCWFRRVRSPLVIALEEAPSKISLEKNDASETISLGQISERANRWASWVASEHGAMPAMSESRRSELLR
jgi:fructokinase